MTDLRTRIETWLDGDAALADATRQDRAAEQVAAALAAGRGRRTRRRTAGTVAVAAGLAAILVPVAAATGIGWPRRASTASISVSPAPTSPGPTDPAPTDPAPTDSPQPSLATSAASSPSVESTPGPGIATATSTDPSTGTATRRAAAVVPGPVTVRYPDGPRRTREVTWPAPASGLPWYVNGDPPDPNVPSADAKVLASVLARAGLGPARYQSGGSGLLGSVAGRPTAYWASVTLTGTAPVGVPEQYGVAITRGGVTVLPRGFDLCGTWPDVRTALGDGSGAADAFFEFGGARTCTVVTRPSGQVVVHLRVEQGARHGAGDALPSPLALWSFAIRPDGTAVQADARATLDAGWGSATVAAVFDRLDRIVETLPYPGRG